MILAESDEGHGAATCSPPTENVTAKAKEILSKGPAIVVADLEAKDLLGVADLPGAKQSIIFNIRLSDD